MPTFVTDVDHIGMHPFRVVDGRMTRPHLHPEIEFNLLLAGSAAYETPRGPVALPLRRLVVFWGGHPHRLVGTSAIEMIGVTLPLGGTAGQPALAGPTRTLISGDWLYGTEPEGSGDALLLRRWDEDLGRRPPSGAEDVCLLEMQARLARMGAGHDATAVEGGHAPAGERLLTVVARHYAEPGSVAALANRAGVHPTYAAKVFTSTFGMPMWRYVEELRIAHAQRLLRATDWPVDRIAHESGYRSRSGFYRAFASTVGRSPAQFRRAQD